MYVSLYNCLLLSANNADKSVKNWSEEDNKEITGKGGELRELAFSKEGSSSLPAFEHNGSAFW